MVFETQGYEDDGKNIRASIRDWDRGGSAMEALSMIAGLGPYKPQVVGHSHEAHSFRDYL